MDKIQVELLLERSALRDEKYQAGNSFLDQLSEIVNKGENSDKEVSELDSPNIPFDSFLDFDFGESEETHSSFIEGLNIFESPQDDPAPPSSDKFLNSLISLLVDEINIEKDFSEYLDLDQVAEHNNGGRAVIELREEDYPDFFETDNYPADIFDAGDTAENFDGILNGISADSTSESIVREKSFIEEEEEATQDDVEETANQLAGLLSDLEGLRTYFRIF